MVTAATAARYDLHSIADLARWAPRLAFGGPPECQERGYCLPGLAQTYGLHFRTFIPLDAGGPLTLQALEAGYVGVALLFSTDPAITAQHLVVLADNRGLQRAENVTPLVRRDVVARYGPRLLAVLNAVSARLTTASLRALDAQVRDTSQHPAQGGRDLAARAAAGLGEGVPCNERGTPGAWPPGTARSLPPIPPSDGSRGGAARRARRRRCRTRSPSPRQRG